MSIDLPTGENVTPLGLLAHPRDECRRINCVERVQRTASECWPVGSFVQWLVPGACLLAVVVERGDTDSDLLSFLISA
jgi:hypothetical protein